MNLLDLKYCLMASTFFFCGCQDKGTGWTPDMIPEDPPTEPEVDWGNTDIHIYKAPLYWSVYHLLLQQEHQDVEEGQKPVLAIDETRWAELMDFVSTKLLPYGYDMICTDGFLSMDGTAEPTEGGYMTHYGGVALTKLSAMCKERGLRLGVYDNPLWMHGPDDAIVSGTDNITLKDLAYKEGEDDVIYPDESDGFRWVVATHEGAKEYIDGFFKYYKELGVDYIRMDFLGWYENGWDRGQNKPVGKGYGRDAYKLAFQYIREAAAKYEVFTSLVMPHCTNHAEVEREYGNMFRVVGDSGDGGWWNFSEHDAGKIWESDWPSSNNMFDGFRYWSDVAGRGKVILDGDFTILSSFETDAQKQSVLSLQLMGGGPIAAADIPGDTFTDDLIPFYTNEEMLALNADRFVGKPVSTVYSDTNDSQIWYGQMNDGDWVIGFFNRDKNNTAERKINFADLGIDVTKQNTIRNLWTHQNEQIISMSDEYVVSLDKAACKIIRLSEVTSEN